RLVVTRVEDEVVDDVSEKVRPFDAPRVTGWIGLIDPRALARADEEHDAAILGGAARCCRAGCVTRRLPPLGRPFASSGPTHRPSRVWPRFIGVRGFLQLGCR